ncbi:MAG: 3-phosphoglycerate dehydrogenase [Oscillospiraceae bacterium]|nr:3-phosphoglycerate dehydrogenase [Oscillospiraceae bacterium]
MYQVHYLNKISPKGTALWTENYETVPTLEDAQAVLVRSASMHDMVLPENLLAVARAGAGVNNIPLNDCAEAGIVVFNTPGANANGVKEMAICGMLLGCRDVVGGIEWVKSIKDQGDIAKKVEKGKSQFAGCEIMDKKLGVIGLGAIGGPLANAAVGLGMKVYGYDPYISIDAAWHLDSHIQPVKTLDEIYETCDIITVHVPLLDSTRKMINAEAMEKMKDGVILLNFARDALVDDDDLEKALKSGKVKRYITDFPNDRTANMEGVVAIPHLGASTEESEDNCARMAVKQVMNYLENGNIINSVNFPNCDMGVCSKPGRIVILHRNIPNTLSRFTGAVAAENINISDLMNRSRGEYACTILDLDAKPSEHVIQTLSQMDGVLRVRKIR